MIRLVVQVRWHPSSEVDEDADVDDARWAQAAGPLFERSVALGGRVIGWGDQSLTVDFAWDGLYDAIDYLVDAPLFPEIAGAICHGPINIVHDAGRVAIATGAAMRQADLISRLARPGEILVSPELVEASDGRVGSAGEPGRRPGRPDVPALILDPERPLRETTPPDEPSLLARKVSEAAAEQEDDSRQVARLTHATRAVELESSSLFPAAFSKALQNSDRSSLDELTDSVRFSHSPEAAERLEAIARMAQGRSGEALRRLRAAKKESSSPSASCRSSLALAVALAAAGRVQEAILESLEALAHARQAPDERGQRASARFLAQLARSVNDPAAAAGWEALCTPDPPASRVPQTERSEAVEPGPPAPRTPGRETPSQ